MKFFGPRFQVPLWLIAAAAILPIAVFGAVLAWSTISDIRGLVGQHYSAIARSLQDSIDQDLRNQLKALQSLAASPELRSTDTSALQARAEQIASTHEGWQGVFLCSRNGLCQTVNSRRYATTSANAPASLSFVAREIPTEEIGSSISDAWTPGFPAIILRAPLLWDGGGDRALVAAIAPASIVKALPGDSADLQVSILDRQFKLIAGIPLSAPPTLAEPHSGRTSSASPDMVVRVAAVSPVTGWQVVVGTTFQHIQSTISGMTTWLMAGGAASLMIALGGASALGWAFGRSVKRSERRVVARNLHVVRREMAAAKAETRAMEKQVEALETELQAMTGGVSPTIWLPREPTAEGKPAHLPPSAPSARPTLSVTHAEPQADAQKVAIELQLAQHELASARAEAALADAAKSRFLAAASHDLRQPFQAMNLYLQVLETMDLAPKAQTALNLLRNSMVAGEELLKALLDISAFEAGMVISNVTVFPIADLMEELAAEYRNLAKERGLSFRKFPIDALVETDRVLAKRMCRNLVHNAFRYTQRGGILVGCRRRGKRILIQVYDTGPGIPADKLQMIFEDFYQLDNPSRDKTKGLGLGLSIVQRTAHLLGQDVWVASRPSHGSVFSITLPLAGRRND